MTLWILLSIVCFAGGIGGIVNALLTDNGFVLPKSVQVENGVSVIRPGFLGNILIGAIAAGISWGLYGPLAAFVIFGSGVALQQNRPESLAISLSSLVGAVLVGVGGARWLTSEVDKSLLRAAATKAACALPSTDASQRIALASPVQALDIAKEMHR
jgi:hypothetical protein